MLPEGLFSILLMVHEIDISSGNTAYESSSAPIRCFAPPPTASPVFTRPVNLQPVIPSITSTASRRRNCPPVLAIG